MSVHSQPIHPVPEETTRIARLAFPKGNRYMTMRDELGTIYTDQDFAELFSAYGQSAVPPWRLALICVMQFLEDLPMARQLFRPNDDYIAQPKLSKLEITFSFENRIRSRYSIHQI